VNKRRFLKQVSFLGAGVPFAMLQLDQVLAAAAHMPDDELADDESFWSEIRAGYRLKPDYVNLENGYYCFMPEVILDRYIDHVREVNYQGSWYLRTTQYDEKKATAARLAEMAGCRSDELIITRNTTESMGLVISGHDWRPGDEAVMAEQDYGAMLNHFDLMARRHGVVNRIVSVPNHPKNDAEIVDLYAAAITDKTRLLMVCHMINLTGQVLPVRKICDMAHSKGVPVLVDGAHAFAHLQFSIKDLNCDFYGTSLHKWLSVPLGAGFLYVNRNKVKKIWPLLANEKRPVDDIYRLSHVGTGPVHVDIAINDAIEYHRRLGGARKEARLRYLQNYWTKKARLITGVSVNTPEDPARHGAIGNVGVDQYAPSDLAKILLEDHKIWTVAIDQAGVRGVRITPNIYTTPTDLDALIRALTLLAEN